MILNKQRDLLDKLAAELIKREVLDEEDLEKMLGPSARRTGEAEESGRGLTIAPGGPPMETEIPAPRPTSA